MLYSRRLRVGRPGTLRLQSRDSLTGPGAGAKTREPAARSRAVSELQALQRSPIAGPLPAARRLQVMLPCRDSHESQSSHGRPGRHGASKRAGSRPSHGRPGARAGPGAWPGPAGRLEVPGPVPRPGGPGLRLAPRPGPDPGLRQCHVQVGCNDSSHNQLRHRRELPV